jgi:L-alanine-DL-glutamate epimerase-like enolase superfamily enzyme
LKIESVDFFYLSMPEVLDIGDGSQDCCLVRVRSGRFEGWGECEASPLVSIAGLVAPMSHSACHPVRDSVIGESVEEPGDIGRINARVRERSFDMLQADHVLSGIDIALWDLLGRSKGEPVWSLLGWRRAEPKRPYASVLFGESPQGTEAKARSVREKGFKAAKFGWGPFGKTTVSNDRNQVLAAREGLDKDGILLIDAGTIFGDDVEQARRRLGVLKDTRAVWFEEPFHSGALKAYAALATEAAPVKLAGGEGCHDLHMARNMIDSAALGYIQIDTGRIGGITTAKQVVEYARHAHVTYVNHTFTSHLALAASIAPFAGNDRNDLCEYPAEASILAESLTREKLVPEDGLLTLPDAPGLGVTVNPDTVRKYLVQVEIKVGGKILYRPPAI